MFDLSGKQLNAIRKSYTLSLPQIGWSEQDPEEVWQGVLSAIRETYLDNMLCININSFCMLQKA